MKTSQMSFTESIKIGKSKMTFKWYIEKSIKDKPIYIRVTYNRQNTKFPSTCQDINEYQSELDLLSKVAEVGHELYYTPKGLLSFISNYKNHDVSIGVIDAKIERLNQGIEFFKAQKVALKKLISLIKTA